jgi:hypothetical protein
MLNLQRRLESLEEAIRLKRAFKPYIHRIVFVDGDGTETGFMVFSDDPELSAPYQSLIGEGAA